VSVDLEEVELTLIMNAGDHINNRDREEQRIKKIDS
jgi:hypothetical protein